MIFQHETKGRKRDILDSQKSYFSCFHIRINCSVKVDKFIHGLTDLRRTNKRQTINPYRHLTGVMKMIYLMTFCVWRMDRRQKQEQQEVTNNFGAIIICGWRALCQVDGKQQLHHILTKNSSYFSAFFVTLNQIVIQSLNNQRFTAAFNLSES